MLAVRVETIGDATSPEMVIEKVGSENLVRLTCEVCREIFHVRRYRAATARFCSQKCGGSWHATTRLARVPKPYMVGNKFRVGIPPVNKGKEGPRGELSPSWKARQPRTCETCSSTFSRPQWVETQNGKSRFCSRLCFATSGVFKGEKSPVWVGGPQTYRGRGWLAARDRVVAEQQGRCADCDIHVGKSLSVHHIKPFRLFHSPQEANVRSNLIGLCQSCHMATEAKMSERHVRRIEAAQRQADLFAAVDAP